MTDEERLIQHLKDRAERGEGSYISAKEARIICDIWEKINSLEFMAKRPEPIIHRYTR